MKKGLISFVISIIFVGCIGQPDDSECVHPGGRLVRCPVLESGTCEPGGERMWSIGTTGMVDLDPHDCDEYGDVVSAFSLHNEVTVRRTVVVDENDRFEIWTADFEGANENCFEVYTVYYADPDVGCNAALGN